MIESFHFINKGQNNKEPVETLETEFVLEDEINKLKEKIGEIDEDKLNPEQKLTFKKIKNKIFSMTKKMVRTIELVAVITSVLAVANNQRTHYELETTNNNEKENPYTYKHEDARTTHILNVLAGREKFTEDDLRNDWDGLISEYFKKYEVKLDKEVNEMTIDEINGVMNILSESDSTIQFNSFKKGFFEHLNFINETKLRYEDINIKKNIYELVWQMEKECGNPKIRFTSEDLKFTPFSQFQGNQHYDPINNIVYVDAWDISPEMYGDVTFFAEMAHAKQFNDNPIGSTVNVLSDYIGMLKRGGLNADKISDEYHKSYKRPGSIEHQAHEVIEPYLTEKYELSKSKDYE